MFRLVRRARSRYLILLGIISLATLGLLLHVFVYYTGGAANLVSRFTSDSPAGNDGKSGTHTFVWPWPSSSTKRLDLRKGLQCPRASPVKGVDISTPEVYSKLNFGPPFRSYWNYTFEKRYLDRRKEWNKIPLKVIVVPHSHNDPGWLQTFDNYFISSTAHILNNMVTKLTKYRDMTFIWTEISFFSKWWSSLKNRSHLRDMVKDLINRGQLEMVAGGWVMTDEAVAHYYSMVDQLIEGHQWLKTTLDVIPSNGWSIDPFGHSSTVPYLLRSSGIWNTVIQRTHYAWKQYLAERQQLDFWWLQPFDWSDTNHSTDILCHMAPFDLYSIKHTCGPDTDVCLQYDFRRVAGEYSESRSIPITPDNIEERSELLLSQYGRIGSLFPHNVVLVPMGDDFRFNHAIEWDQQYQNYREMFEFINARKDWNAEVRFGTLEDYFRAVHQRMNKVPEGFPNLVGDFLPYGDIYGEGRPSYWTGYFTTRPYWKHMCRELEHWLRSAEIIYTISRTYIRQKGYANLLQRLDQDYSYLTSARANLGLFQHHDAITGTSKEPVMLDYGIRMFRSIKEAMGVIAHSVLYLMSQEEIRRPADLQAAHPATSYLYPDTERINFESLPQKIPLTVPSEDGRNVIIYNSKGIRSQEPIRLTVKTPKVRVVNSFDGADVPIQINPIWNGTAEILSDFYEVLFLADLPPLSLTKFTIYTDRGEHENYTQVPERKSAVSVMVNDAISRQSKDSVFSFQNPTDEDIEISSPLLTAKFSKNTGLMQSLILKDKDIVKNRAYMYFQAYRSEEFRSGAYLFQTNSLSPVKNITSRYPVIRVVRGAIASEVTVIYPGVITFSSRVYHTDGPLGHGVEIESIFDLTQQADVNIELFLRLQTDIRNDNVFYTDQNGFQMIRRYAHKKLPLEANYYPVTSAAFIEDSHTRLTLLASHAHGGTSIRSGWLELMLDRRLRNDDNRGLGEGVLDNKRTMAKFWLLLEKREDGSFGDEVPNLSLTGHILSSVLLYPPVVLTTNGKIQRRLKTRMAFLGSSFPCDLHLMNLRTLPIYNNFHSPSNNSLLLVHNKSYSCYIKHSTAKICDVSPDSNGPNELQHLNVDTIYRTSLTGVHTLDKIENISNIGKQPMEIMAYNVTFSS